MKNYEHLVGKMVLVIHDGDCKTYGVFYNMRPDTYTIEIAFDFKLRSGNGMQQWPHIVSIATEHINSIQELTIKEPQ